MCSGQVEHYFFHLKRISSLLFNSPTHICWNCRHKKEVVNQRGSPCRKPFLIVDKVTLKSWWPSVDHDFDEERNVYFHAWRFQVHSGSYRANPEWLQAACFRLTSLIFRTCLCCVYSLSFTEHFGNSNLSLSLIMRTTHSASGLGLPECLICCDFYCSHIVGAVNACVAVHCLLMQRKAQYSHQWQGASMCKVTELHENQSSYFYL